MPLPEVMRSMCLARSATGMWRRYCSLLAWRLPRKWSCKVPCLSPYMKVGRTQDRPSVDTPATSAGWAMAVYAWICIIGATRAGLHLGDESLSAVGKGH